MQNIEQLAKLLLESFADARLSKDEKREIVNATLSCTEEQKRYLKNRCFDVFRDYFMANLNAQSTATNDILSGYSWLEKAVKALDGPVDLSPGPRSYFSPGHECLDCIVDACRRTMKSIDICVFTISDNRITDAIIDAHLRGVTIRIISDNDKCEDMGSDIDMLLAKGIDVRLDQTDNHMHHKFAVFDKKILINGSFNWTRSASERNEENIICHYDAALIDQFSSKFNALWQSYS